MDRPSLYELAQIDRDRYTIVGIELNVEDPTTAAVYAFDRSVHSVVRLEEIVELGLSRGEIPVVRFDIPEVDAGEFIRHAFRRISVRLVIQGLRDQPLIVSEPSSAQAKKARGTRTALSTAPFKPRCPVTTTIQPVISRVTVQLTGAAKPTTAP
jgi:hypothetical protein